MDPSFKVVLSGPRNRQGPFLRELETAGAYIVNVPRAAETHGLPVDPKLAWITCLVKHPDDIQSGKSGWRLRLHWPHTYTPGG